MNKLLNWIERGVRYWEFREIMRCLRGDIGRAVVMSSIMGVTSN